MEVISEKILCFIDKDHVYSHFQLQQTLGQLGTLNAFKQEEDKCALMKVNIVRILNSPTTRRVFLEGGCNHLMMHLVVQTSLELVGEHL